RLDLPPFTLVGATTRSGLLSNPFRDRFGVQLHLDFYPVTELAQIVLRSSEKLNTALDPDAAEEIAKRSRGTPRIANRLIKRVRDFAQVRYHDHGPEPVEITRTIASEALSLLEIDPRGLDSRDRKYLETLIKKFDGGP